MFLPWRHFNSVPVFAHRFGKRYASDVRDNANPIGPLGDCADRTP
jgi:hypothetical protein